MTKSEANSISTGVIVAGFLCCLTVVGSPVGLPLIVLGIVLKVIANS
ncbi:MAG: hypothetical protein QM811_02780 [Pirellulales bacterium]